jgi:hypothetical protein
MRFDLPGDHWSIEAGETTDDLITMRTHGAERFTAEEARRLGCALVAAAEFVDPPNKSEDNSQ